MRPTSLRVRAARAALAVLTLPAAAAAQTTAEQLAAQAAEFDALVARLTPPLSADVVRRAVHHPQAAAAAAARGLAVQLSVHRGAAAAEGLLALAAHRDAEVRVTALRGLASAGLRSAAIVEGVRIALADFDSTVRRAAIAALGAVGEADDVTMLVELLDPDEENAVRAVAYRALRALTGARTDQDMAAWRYWWSHAGPDLGRRVDAAVALIAAGGAEARLVAARDVLRRAAWFAPRRLEDTAREWLGSEEPRLRIEALRLVAAARLVDVVAAVSDSVRFESEPEVVEVARECEVALGARAAEPCPATPGASR